MFYLSAFETSEYSMWVFAYDPADGDHVQRRDMSYWPLRHGSPLREEPGIWVPTSFVSCLREFSEVGDLYIGYLPDESGPSRPKFYTSNDNPGRDLFEKLDKLGPEDFALALEFTYHSNWSSNAIQRLPLLYQSISRGIPTAYALPESAVAMRGTDRRGDQNIHHRKLKSALQPICEKMVKNNEPVTFEKIKSHVEDERNDIDVEIGETSNNKADPKVPLYCLTAQDSFETPVFTVQYDEVVTAVPRDWKVAGKQLGSVFDVIDDAMSFMEENEEAATVESGLFAKHNTRDQTVIDESPPNRPRVRRNKRWDEYHLNTRGFPDGSLGIVTDPPKRHSKDHNYSLPSNKLADLYFHPGQTGTKESFNNWVNHIGSDRTQTRMFGEVDFGLLPDDLKDRPMVVTYKVSPYGGDMDSRDRWQNVDERTYAGKFVLFDLCFVRASKGTAERPRAMATDRSDRQYVLAANLPMPSEVMFSQYKKNARFRTYLNNADIIVFDDGGYLGRIWWDEDESPVQVF